jgi:hypothetical protein
MAYRWLARSVCLLALVGLVLSLGCNAFSAERTRMRSYSVRTDLDHMVDDADWMLGLDEPSTMYDESLAPYRH